jgi:2-polyprenyl-3-methyl-5-hydroxy-6-metoxy-1,4-benzoquinol methylase
MEFTRASDQKRLRFILNAIQENIPSAANVLDIGCGNGIIARSIGAIGFNVLGIDSSDKTINTARQHNANQNVRFEVANAEELLYMQRQYDAVVCSEVLEHLHDPSKLLNQISGLIKENGILIVTVPNGKGPREIFVTKPVQNLQSKKGFLSSMLMRFKSLLGYTGQTIQSSADDLTHIQFFTKKQLQHLARQTGFEIVKFRKLNFLEQVFPFSLIANRSKRIQRLDLKLADWLPYQFASGFMMVWKKSV